MKKFSIAITGMVLFAHGALAADKIGIATCDDFLDKYEACVTTKISGAQQTTFKTQMEQLRKVWADAAKDPNTKTTLEPSCKASADQMKTALQSYGCSF